jgi:hypothetical protein
VDMLSFSIWRAMWALCKSYPEYGPEVSGSTT